MLATASHYWPLDEVDGIHELWDQIGNRPGYVNGSNISMCIHNQAWYTHGNAPSKCLSVIPLCMVSVCFSPSTIQPQPSCFLNVLNAFILYVSLIPNIIGKIRLYAEELMN